MTCSEGDKDSLLYFDSHNKFMTRCLKEKRKRRGWKEEWRQWWWWWGGAGGGGSGYAVSAKKCETKMKREGAETGGEQGSQMGKGCTGLGDKYFKRSFCVKTHTKT